MFHRVTGKLREIACPSFDSGASPRTNNCDNLDRARRSLTKLREVIDSRWWIALSVASDNRRPLTIKRYWHFKDLGLKVWRRLSVSFVPTRGSRFAIGQGLNTEFRCRCISSVHVFTPFKTAMLKVFNYTSIGERRSNIGIYNIKFS